MKYKFTTQSIGDHKIVIFRGKANHQLLVNLHTSPKKFLGYFEELQKACYIPEITIEDKSFYYDHELEFVHSIYETTLLDRLLTTCTNCPDTIMKLQINESCFANDGFDLYKVTRISRHLCHCKWLPYAG